MLAGRQKSAPKIPAPQLQNILLTACGPVV